MGLLQQASLAITPNAVKAGKLYSVIPDNGTGDLDVVRATSATRVNEQGLVEIPRTNLLLRSEDFDNSAWTKSAGVVITSNSEISPNGTLTADTINFGASNRIVSQATTLATGVVATGSIYVKGISGQTIQLAVGGVDVLFTLNGNWQRVNGTRTSINSTFNINTFGGATARIISIWGAQLEAGNVATEYIPTTSVIRTRFAGITQDGSSASNIPRIDYTNGSCPSILVEPQRTNLLLRSEEFDNTTTWTSGVVGTGVNPIRTANTTISPSGVQDADTIVFNRGAGNTLVDQSLINQQLTIATTGTYYFSVWLKATASGDIGKQVFIRCGNAAPLQAVTLTANWVIYKTTASVTAGVKSFQIGNRGTITTGNSVSVDLWGAQLEAGENATSYIPTTSSAVTRVADRNNIILTNKTFWNKNNFTIYWEGTFLYGAPDQATFGFGNVTDIVASGASLCFYNNGVGFLKNQDGTSPGGLTIGTPLPNGSNYKLIIKREGTEIKWFRNGVLLGVRTGEVVDYTYLGLNSGSSAYYLNKSFMIPSSLTDQQCIDLTTL